MIRILAVSYTQIINCCKNDGTTAVEIASDEYTIEPVHALCEFSLLVREQNDSILSFEEVYSPPTQSYTKNEC